MAESIGNATAPNGNTRSVRIVGNITGNISVWTIFFKSEWPLYYNNLYCNVSGGLNGNPKFAYNGDNIWVAVITNNQVVISPGQSITVTASVTVPAVGSTASTTSKTSLKLTRPSGGGGASPVNPGGSVPSAPGAPTITRRGHTDLDVSFSRSASSGGSPIDHYLLRRWDGSDATGNYVNISQNMALSRNIPKLVPGKTYSLAVYAHNKYGYSPRGPVSVVRTRAGGFVKVDGAFKEFVPYVKQNGVWKMAIPYIKVADFWKPSG